MDENATTPSPAPEKGKPEKYIRTFAGDMEVLKQGGSPDLAPLGQPRPGAKERLVASSPIAPPPPPPPPAPLPSPRPAPPPPPPPELAPIKTYAGDFSERMKDTRASAATVLAAEQDRTMREPEALPEKQKLGNTLYVIGGVVLLIIGVVGAYIAYSRYQTATAPVVPAQTVPAPIFVDEREQIGQGGLAPIVAIQQSVARPLSGSNTVRLLYLATSTDKSVFASLPVSAPDILVRNVNPARSMAGVVAVAGVQSPFFILSVSSYGYTLSGMLSWETLMPRTLSALFPPYPSAAGAATSTSPTPATVPAGNGQLGFRDETVGNHDVRVYRDAAGRSVMLYGYWNQSTLVIARDPAAFTEILGRLATSRAPQ